jgi:FlaA1/EpsC-like NDP-sugar epimerase
MVTGEWGSIGADLSRQILYLQPKQLVLVDHSEIAIYEIYNDLLKKLDNLTPVNHRQNSLLPILGSVTDAATMENLIRVHQPQIIYHAAAYKHVPLVEENPFEGIKNNTFGTLKMVQLAVKFKIPNFVLVSTDKAVNPTNIMGASKRLAEMILQAFASEKTQTIMTMVRFGNVLASSGSVIPKFREQIKAGGPVTVTDFRITRYFMTIPEAALLVMFAGFLAQGGEVFLLDMGQPVRIVDLAKRMIELSGLEVRDQNNPKGDIELVEIGMRPGEKLYEELLLANSSESTSHPRIYKAHEEFLSLDQLEAKLNELEKIITAHNKEALIDFLIHTVKGYHSSRLLV